jgi:hypothetical protein
VPLTKIRALNGVLEVKKHRLHTDFDALELFEIICTPRLAVFGVFGKKVIQASFYTN